MLPKAGVNRQTMKWSGLLNASAVECREAMNANREDCEGESCRKMPRERRRSELYWQERMEQPKRQRMVAGLVKVNSLSGGDSKSE